MNQFIVDSKDEFQRVVPDLSGVGLGLKKEGTPFSLGHATRSKKNSVPSAKKHFDEAFCHRTILKHHDGESPILNAD